MSENSIKEFENPEDYNAHSDMNALDDFSEKSHRPIFLSILCIMTFVVSGYHLIMAIVGFFSDKSFDPEQWQSISEQMGEAMARSDATSQEMVARIMESVQRIMRLSVEKSSTLATAAVAASGLSILGAYLMFKLKQVGYYVYILAKVIGVLIPLIVFGVNIATILIYGFVAVIGVLFIILYGINRKYMH